MLTIMVFNGYEMMSTELRCQAIRHYQCIGIVCFYTFDVNCKAIRDILSIAVMYQ